MSILPGRTLLSALGVCLAISLPISSSPAYAQGTSLEDVIKGLAGAAIQHGIRQPQRGQRPRAETIPRAPSAEPIPRERKLKNVARNPKPVPIDRQLLQAQRRLSQIGYDVGEPDGRDGPRTKAGLGLFQRDHGLKASLSLTSATSALLMSQLAQRAAHSQVLGEHSLLSVKPGIDLSGRDYRSPQNDAALAGLPLDGCYSACLADTQCAAFTYNAEASACFLKHSVPSDSPFEGAISGIKSAQPVGSQTSISDAGTFFTPVAPVAPLSSEANIGQSAFDPEGTRPIAPVEPGAGGAIAPLLPFGADNGSGLAANNALPSIGLSGPLAGLPALGAGASSFEGTWRTTFICTYPERLSVALEISYQPELEESKRGIFRLMTQLPDGTMIEGERRIKIIFDPMSGKVESQPGDWNIAPDVGRLNPNFGNFVGRGGMLEGRLAPDGAALTGELYDCRGKTEPFRFVKISEEQLATEKAELAKRSERFASHPMIGVWQGYGLCNDGPFGMGLMTRAVPEGISATVKIFPLIQNVSAPQLEYDGVIGQVANSYILHPSAAQPRYANRGDLSRIEVDRLRNPVVAASLRLEPQARTISGQIDHAQCSALSMVPISAEEFGYLDVAYNPAAPIWQGSDMTPSRQVFTATSLSSACRAILGWQGQLFSDPKEITNSRDAHIAVRQANRLLAALFLRENFEPFFGRDPETITLDEGTALYNVVNQCGRAEFPLGVIQSIYGYFPNATANVKGIKERIDEDMTSVRPAAEWRQKTLRTLESMEGHFTERSAYEELRTGLKTRQDALLPGHAALLEQNLVALDAKITAAEDAEKERLRQERIANLLGKLDSGQPLALADLGFLKSEISNDPSVFTASRRENFEAQLATIVAERRVTLDAEVADKPPSSETAEREKHLTEDLAAFKESVSVAAFLDEVAKQRRERERKVLDEVDVLIAASDTKEKLITAARRIEALHDLPSLGYARGSRREELRKKAEDWVTEYLAAMPRASGEPAPGAESMTATQAVESEVADGDNLLGDFAELAASQPGETAGSTRASTTPAIFSNGQLKQGRLLLGLYEGNFDAVYKVPRRTSTAYIRNLVTYYKEACPAVLPSGMLTYVARQQMPDSILSGNRDQIAADGLRMLADTMLQMTQNPGQVVDQAVQMEELQTQAYGDAGVLGQEFGCPGDGLRKIFDNTYAFLRNPTSGVSAEKISLYDSCVQSDTYVYSDKARYCKCTAPILERNLSANFELYVKADPMRHLDDVWQIFPHVAREQWECRK